MLELKEHQSIEPKLIPIPQPTDAKIRRGWKRWEINIRRYLKSTPTYRVRPASIEGEINPHRFGQ